MNRPVFIIGCPRSGTTLLLTILAKHKNLGWISHLVNRFPTTPFLSFFNRILDLPILGDYLYQIRNSNQERKSKWFVRAIPKPVEPWQFYNHYLKNFQSYLSNSQEFEISQNEINRITQTVNRSVQFHGKQRFLSKYTDFSRIALIKHIFPDAFFIYINREQLPVVASYGEKMINRQFNTFEEKECWIKHWPVNYQKYFEGKELSPHVFAAVQWCYFNNEIKKDLSQLDQQDYAVINYSDLLDEPDVVITYVLERVGLPYDRRVKKFVRKNVRVGKDKKFMNKLADSDVETIQSFNAYLRNE